MSVRARVRAQTLDTRITVERKVTTDTPSGGQTATWSPIVTCAARVDGAKASGPEPVVNGGIRTPRDYTVWLRADVYIRHEIRPADRVRWARHGVTRVLDVLDVPDQGLRGNLIAMICRAGLNQG